MRSTKQDVISLYPCMKLPDPSSLEQFCTSVPPYRVSDQGMLHTSSISLGQKFAGMQETHSKNGSVLGNETTK